MPVETSDERAARFSALEQARENGRRLLINTLCLIEHADSLEQAKRIAARTLMAAGVANVSNGNIDAIKGAVHAALQHVQTIESFRFPARPATPVAYSVESIIGPYKS